MHVDHHFMITSGMSRASKSSHSQRSGEKVMNFFHDFFRYPLVLRETSLTPGLFTERYSEYSQEACGIGHGAAVDKEVGRVEEDLNSATDTTNVLQVYFLNRRNCLDALVSLIAGFDIPPHNSFRYFLTQNNYTVEYISNQLQESRDIDFDDLKVIRRTSQGWHGFKSNREELFHLPITWFVSRYDLIIDNESYDVENVDGINFTITLSKIPTDKLNKLSRYRFKSDLIICRLFISG